MALGSPARIRPQRQYRGRSSVSLTIWVTVERTNSELKVQTCCIFKIQQMNRQPLPKKLAKEPLIDVVFEVRFSAIGAGSTVLPGLLFSKLPNVGNIEPLPALQLPQQIRDSDPQFQFAPLNRIWWGNFALLVGDKTLAVGCKMPYPGWDSFRSAIVQVLSLLKETNFFTSIDRYSLKYVDFFDTGNDHSLALTHFDLDLRIGKHKLAAENTVLRIEIPRDSFLHAIQMVTEANIQQEGTQVRRGAILDVDTLRLHREDDMNKFVAELPEALERIHLANKEVLFECLSVEGLKRLEPQYE